MASWGPSKYTEIKLHNFCFYFIYFWKTNTSLKLASLPHFLHDFWRKRFLLHYITSPNFIAWLPLLIGQYVYCNCLLTRLWHHFEIKPDLSNQAVFSKWQICHSKNLDILRMKRAFKMKKSIFHHSSRDFI